MRRIRIAIPVLALVFQFALQGSVPQQHALAQVGEPRFSYPGARRFELTSYFDHYHPDYGVDNDLTIYTTEKGLQSNGCADCFQSGSVWVCGYHTAPNCGGRRVYYDGHPAYDYTFPFNTPISTAAPGIAHQRPILGYAVTVDHGGDYWTKYGHVNRDSRIAEGTQVERGQQVALSSNTGTSAAHLHFEARFGGETGTFFDPYGWWGQWYEDPWNQPWGHTDNWWRSPDPIPMGYRDQNHVAQGPFQVSGAIAAKWDALDGGPGSPVSAQASGSCPGNYGDCQFFEKGYMRWDYSSVTYYAYAETLVGRIHYVAARSSNTILAIQNLGGASAQVSVIFWENGHVVDSRTYKTLPSGSTWQLNVQQALQEMTNRFMGIAAVYSNQPVAFSLTYVNPLPTVFLPLVSK